LDEHRFGRADKRCSFVQTDTFWQMRQSVSLASAIINRCDLAALANVI
jgi:hypothetical protein